MTNNIQKISRYAPHKLQGALQLEVARPRAGLAREFAFERRAISIFSILLITLVLAYVYFVASSVFAVMARADADRNIRTAETNLASMEQKYLTSSSAISKQTADSEGLMNLGEISYVYRPGNTALANIADSKL